MKWAAKELHSGFNPSEIAQSRIEVFQKVRQETLAKLEDDWDLFIVYTKLLDAVGHLFWQEDRIVEKHYQMVESFAGEIRKNLPDGAFMAVISDHGMQPLQGSKHHGGSHSHHAYASFNRRIDVSQSLKITDLYPIVRGVLQQRTDEELIMGRLRELGYI